MSVIGIFLFFVISITINCSRESEDGYDCSTLICERPSDTAIWNEHPQLRHDKVCNCSRRTGDLIDVVCAKWSLESFTMRLHKDFFSRPKIIFDGNNKQIPLNFVPEITACLKVIWIAEISNFCPIDAISSTKVNVTDLFRTVSSLEFLKMTNNCIESITDDFGEKFITLKQLSLSYNRLTEIPNFERKFLWLKKLDFSNNFISIVSRNNFVNISTLESLNMSMNNLSILREDLLMDLQYLEVLDLSHNSISELPEFFISDKNPRLEQLYLNNNNLIVNETEFDSFSESNWFQKARNLIHLDLSSNNQLNLEFLLFDGLKKLQTLNLNNMSISTIDILQFWELSSVRKISLKYNVLTKLPDLIFHDNVIHLDLIHNAIKILHLPPMRKIRGTQTLSLDVSNNCIQTIDNQINDFILIPGKYILNFKCSFCCLDSVHPDMLIGLMGQLDLSYNNITRIDYNGLYNFSNSDRIINLNLSHNQIDLLPPKSDPFWSRISILDLSHNDLKSVKNLTVTRSMKKIYLNNNSIDELSGIIAELSLSNVSDIKLAGNPWKCDCEMRNIVLNLPIFTDKQLITCFRDGTEYYLTNIDNLCLNEIGDIVYLWLLLPITIILVAVSSLVVFYYKYKSEILYYLFAKGMCLKFVCEEDIDANKTYDAFVSYSHEDEEWVAKFLMRGLENESPSYKLCLHNRDWLAGEYIPDQIVKSVQNSRRTIIVLTNSFLQSEWSRMEFDVAYYQSAKDRVRRLIVIIPGEIPDLSEVSEEFRTFITMTTYIEVSKPYFWRKLRACMPRIATIHTLNVANMNVDNNAFETDC